MKESESPESPESYEDKKNKIIQIFALAGIFTACCSMVVLLLRTTLILF